MRTVSEGSGDHPLLDEPAAGLSQSERADFAKLVRFLSFLRKWAESGTAVVLVEQHLKATAPYADTAMIIERGKVKFSCKASELNEKPATLEPAESAH